MTSTRIYFVDSKGKILSAKWLDGAVDNEVVAGTRATDRTSIPEPRLNESGPVPIT